MSRVNSRPRRPAPTQKIVTATRMRHLTALFLVIALVLVGRLARVQLKWGPELQTVAADQRTRTFTDPARRGEIVDREGNLFAYTMQARSLTVSPVILRRELAELARNEMYDQGATRAEAEAQQDARVEDTLRQMANDIPAMIAQDSPTDSDEAKLAPRVSSKDILDKLHADSDYEVLVRNVDPDVAAAVAEKFHGVAADQQDIREYPNGAVGENIVGRVSMDGQGQFGLEASSDSILTGINGRSTEDVSANGQVIPGTMRDAVPAVNGATVELTVDLDLQTYVQQLLEQAKANSKAQGAEAVVLDAATGEVLAMANTDTIDPNGDLDKQLKNGRSFDNPSISHPFEPGSVAKIITATAAIEEGLTTPDAVRQVPGSIEMSGVTVADAWEHEVAPYTTAGIFGKSSNVGTLMLAQEVGEDTFADYLDRFGVGETTGIELPNESAGLVPAKQQWSGGTFANLPIGQGMSMTTLQLASVYQSLANGGERIEPRIVKKVTAPTGEEIPQEKARPTRVASEETARVVVDMFRAAFQDDPNGVNNGTAHGNEISGYQLSGKTGTAQQVDPDTGAYSNSDYWITFAGIAPADDPRFVVAVMLDDPEQGPLEGGGGGESAAPVFTQIANWLITRENIPRSPDPGEPMILQAQ